MKFLIALAGLVLALYLSACLFLYLTQRSFLYFPTPPAAPPVEATPITMPSDGETLRLLRLGNGPHALLYFGGNAEDVALNAPLFAERFERYTVYLINYRGYGGSTGKPTEAALKADALAVYDALAPGHQSISVIGRSLGSGIAVYLAAERPISKLALVTPYDSILNVAKGAFPFFPVSLLLKDRFDSVTHVPHVKAPVLVVVAEQDGVIARPITDALIAAFPAHQVSTVVLRGATHNALEGDPTSANYGGQAAGQAQPSGYRAALLHFLN